MKGYIIGALILVAGVAVVWVVLGTLLSTTEEAGPRYAVAQGTYECLLVGGSGFAGMINTEGFPARRRTEMAYPPSLPPTAHEDTRKFLGSTFRIGIYDMDKENARRATDAAFDLIYDIVARLDADNPDSELSSINGTAAQKTVDISPELASIVKRSLEIAEKSDGALDITAGPLRRLWEEGVEDGRGPPPEEIRKALRSVGYKFVELKETGRNKHTLHFTRAGVSLDLDGVIRGFICDDVAWFLRKKQNVKRGFVRVDNNITCFIRSKGDRPFSMGIPHSSVAVSGELQTDYIFNTEQTAVVTKGTFGGYRYMGRVAYYGVIDPRNGAPAKSVSSCTVVGPNTMSCDALASAICVEGGQHVRQFIVRFNSDVASAEKSNVLLYLFIIVLVGAGGYGGYRVYKIVQGKRG